MTIFTAYDLDGEPLSGLTPDEWIVYVDTESGDPVTPPVIEDIGGGQYRIEAGETHTGILDLGAAVANRYVVILPQDRWACVGWTDEGAPATGLTPVWARHVDAESGDPVPPPAIVTVGGYIHTVAYSEPRTVGLIDLGSEADPRYVEYDSEAPGSTDKEPPVVEVVSPEVGSSITPSTPIVIKITDDKGLARVLLYARYAGHTSAEVIHDGGDYLPPYTGSTRTSIEGGWQYTLRRTGGWVGAISLYVRAVDASGNEVAL